MIWKLSDVVPNPFRDLNMFPLQQRRIEKLMGVFKATGYDENILGRVRDGKLQLAYGHHRLQALKNLGVIEAEFIVQELSDAAMLEKMSTDNDTAFSHGMRTVLENVRAAVLGFASGKIARPEIDKHTDPKYLRYAPSFIAGLKNPPKDSVPYTRKSVGIATGMLLKDGHHGWKADTQVQGALDALELVELGLWTIEQCLHEIEGKEDPEVARGKEPDGKVVICADYLSTVCEGIRERARAGLVAAQKNTEEATAQVLEGQRQIEAARKAKEQEEAARFGEYQRVHSGEWEKEANEQEAKWREARTKAEKEKQRTTSSEFRKERRAINKKAEVAREAEETARLAARKAEEEARKETRKAAGKLQPYWPELSELLKRFEEPLPACASDVLKYKARLTPEQRKEIWKAGNQAIRSIKAFWDQLEPRQKENVQ